MNVHHGCWILTEDTFPQASFVLGGGRGGGGVVMHEEVCVCSLCELHVQKHSGHHIYSPSSSQTMKPVIAGQHFNNYSQSQEDFKKFYLT